VFLWIALLGAGGTALIRFRRGCPKGVLDEPRGAFLPSSPLRFLSDPD
jgi:hypothetical protein